MEVPLSIYYIYTCYVYIFYYCTASESSKRQYVDNCRWIREAGKHKLVVGSQARILYANEQGRKAIALAFNKAIAEGRLKVEEFLEMSIFFTFCQNF